jgi:hypothetical protein
MPADCTRDILCFFEGIVFSMKRFLLSVALIFFLVHTPMAQNMTYGGLFPTIDHSVELSKRIGYNVYVFDAIKPYANTINDVTDASRSLYIYGEAGLTYAISKQLSITASYVYERQNPFRNSYRNENRAFQQLTLKLPLGKTELKQRLRFDERFIQNRETGGTPFTHRLRYLIGLKRPIRNDKMYFFLYSEAFFNTTSGAQYVFNENWSAAQIGFKLNGWSSLETGLLYVGWINNRHADWLNQFYLQVSWVTHFDLAENRQDR